MSFFTDYSVKIVNDVLIISVHLLRATNKDAGLFKELMAIAICNKKNILIELSETEFMDSTFLGVLVVGLKKISKKDGSIGLIGIHDSVEMLIEKTNLLKVSKVYSTMKEAQKSFLKKKSSAD